MNFSEAVDAVCASIDHEDVATELGVSVQTIRQARLQQGAPAWRPPPQNWQQGLIRLAERRVKEYRKLIDALRKA